MLNELPCNRRTLRESSPVCLYDVRYDNLAWHYAITELPPRIILRSRSDWNVFRHVCT